MTRHPREASVWAMLEDRIELLVLQEFRLRAADADRAVARIVAATSPGIEPAVPLLTSIDDRRDVATLRGLHAGEATATGAAQRAALDPLVLSWAQPKHYGARVAERSESPPSYFRLAVTESGINAGGEARVTTGEDPALDGPSSRPVGLVWIGAPVGTYAGLLVLLGTYDDPHGFRRDPSGWPHALSRELGVRIYESGGV